MSSHRSGSDRSEVRMELKNRHNVELEERVDHELVAVWVGSEQ